MGQLGLCNHGDDCFYARVLHEHCWKRFAEPFSNRLWGYTLSIALLIAAIISPILGALADYRGSKKRYLGYFVVLGVTGTALLYFVGEGEWLKASLFFIIGNVGFAAANVFYDSLLPHIAKPEEVDRVSAKKQLYHCLRLDKVIVDCS